MRNIEEVPDVQTRRVKRESTMAIEWWNGWKVMFLNHKQHTEGKKKQATTIQRTNRQTLKFVKRNYKHIMISEDAAKAA